MAWVEFSVVGKKYLVNLDRICYIEEEPPVKAEHSLFKTNSEGSVLIHFSAMHFLKVLKADLEKAKQAMAIAKEYPFKNSVIVSEVGSWPVDQPKPSDPSSPERVAQEVFDEIRNKKLAMPEDHKVMPLKQLDGLIVCIKCGKPVYSEDLGVWTHLDVKPGDVVKTPPRTEAESYDEMQNRKDFTKEAHGRVSKLVEIPKEDLDIIRQCGNCNQPLIQIDSPTGLVLIWVHLKTRVEDCEMIMGKCLSKPGKRLYLIAEK